MVKLGVRVKTRVKVWLGVKVREAVEVKVRVRVGVAPGEDVFVGVDVLVGHAVFVGSCVQVGLLIRSVGVGHSMGAAEGITPMVFVAGTPVGLSVGGLMSMEISGHILTPKKPTARIRIKASPTRNPACDLDRPMRALGIGAVVGV